MSLSESQIESIIKMDDAAKQILSNGSEEELLISLCSKVSKIKEIMDSSTEDELNQYCYTYDGFYHYIKLLEQIAQGCADGTFDDLLK